VQVPSENLDGAGRIDGEELGFGASEAPFELRALEIALDVVRVQKRCSCTCIVHLLQELKPIWHQFGITHAACILSCALVALFELKRLTTPSWTPWGHVDWQQALGGHVQGYSLSASTRQEG
jgi:hypothetical protein